MLLGSRPYLTKQKRNEAGHPFFKPTPNLNISARMSWSISDILKPFKKKKDIQYDYIYYTSRFALLNDLTKQKQDEAGHPFFKKE